MCNGWPIVNHQGAQRLGLLDGGKHLRASLRLVLRLVAKRASLDHPSGKCFSQSVTASDSDRTHTPGVDLAPSS